MIDIAKRGVGTMGTRHLFLVSGLTAILFGVIFVFELKKGAKDMINIGICDDSSFMRNEIRNNLLNYSIKKDIEYNIFEFEKGEDLLADKNSFDLLFLDYQFENGGADGIKIAKEYIKIKKSKIIFVSSYPNVVFESFEVGTFRFLVKPIDELKFEQAMDSFLETLKESSVLTIRNNRDSVFINMDEISYLESVGKKTIVHFINDKDDIEINELLAAIEKRLTSSFFRCYKSYIVNMKYIKSYNRTGIQMENEEMIPIGRTKYKEFMDAHSDYVAGRRK